MTDKEKKRRIVPKYVELDGSRHVVPQKKEETYDNLPDGWVTFAEYEKMDFQEGDWMVVDVTNVRYKEEPVGYIYGADRSRFQYTSRKIQRIITSQNSR